MNRTQLQSILEDAEQSVAQQDYSGASDLLQSADCTQMSNDELISYLITKSHALIYQGEFDTSHLDMALELLRGKGISKDLAKARLLKGLALSKQGRHSDAQQHYLEASVSYRNLDDIELAAVAINLLGLTHLRMGDFEASQKAYTQALEMMGLLRSRTDNETLRRKERDIAHNLANLKIHFGRLREGLQDYDVYPISRDELESDAGINYLLNRSKAYALLNETSGCREILEQCRPLLDGRPRELSLYEQWMALSYAVEGDFTKALEFLQKAMAEIQNSDSDLLPGILRRQAECYWQLDQIGKSKQCAKLAFESAMLSRERVEVAASYRLLGLAANLNREKRARQYFQQSLDLLEAIDSQHELAKTRKLAACSGEFSVEESSELLHQSNRYFDKEEIPRLSDRHTEDILGRIAISQSSPAQKKKISDILDKNSST